MRVLLVSANRVVLPDPVAPLGLACVAAALREAGHEVRLLDLLRADDPPAVVRSELDVFSPEVVGVGLRNVDNTLHGNARTYLELVGEVIDAARAWGDPVIVIGGSGYSLFHRRLLEHFGLEFGIRGEGEEAMVRFLEAVAGARPFSQVPGLVRLRNGKCTVTPPASIRNLDRLPLPARDMIDNALYLRLGGSGNIQSKRGCAFACIYCTYPLLEGHCFRLRDPRNVVDELCLAGERFGIDHFYFVDNVFTRPVEHAAAICDEITARGLRVAWSCYGHPGREVLPLLDKLAAAGCRGIDFGTDSGCDAQLGRLGKSFRTADVLAVSRATRQAGIAFCHSMLLGGPGETYDTAMETLDRLEEWDPDAAVIIAGIRIYPGTPLASLARREGVLPEHIDLLPPRYYISPALSRERLERVLDRAQSHPHWVIPERKTMLDERIQAKIRRYGFRGPLWEYLAHVGARRRSRRAGSEISSK
jgi:radical SAM superfamily enzyme YgiQ (UPF0313 family)